MQMRSMLVAPSGERQLIELKAVDAAWPLVGAPGAVAAPCRSPTRWRRATASTGCSPSRSCWIGSGLHPGDTVRLGTATFRVSGALVSEPDRVATAALLGPRVLISAAALPQTGLIVPGSMVRYALRLTCRRRRPGRPSRGDCATAFPDRAGASATPPTPRPACRRFIDQTSLFLTLVGLTSLLVGGIGVANGVRAWLDARARTIATLRCLGASAGWCSPCA